MPDQGLTIGIDFGGTSVKIGVVNGHELIARPTPIKTKDYTSPASLIFSIASEVNRLKKEHPNILAIGVGVPGFVHLKKGMVYELPNVPGWSNVYLRDQLTEHTGLPCALENDANCMAYAEWKHGAGKGKEDLICLTLGTGVGSGIISNNRMIQGSTSTAGELGHTSIHYRGVRGTYGNNGSLEDYIGHNEITANAQRAYAEQGYAYTMEQCEPIPLEKNALNGDPIALEIWNGIAEKLACALANACWLLNPEAIVIGGGVAKAGDLLFDPLKTYISNQLAHPFCDELEILPAHFSNEAGIIGAASLARDLIDQPAS